MMGKEDFVNNDSMLIKRMRQGDDTAFELFVHTYYGEILNYCHYHCPDEEYAIDLTQETFVRFFAKLSDYHYNGKTRKYLYTIAGNLCKDYWKKIKELPLEETDLNKKSKGEECQIEDTLNKVAIEQALKELPMELQEVVFLYYFQDLKISEISDTLNIGLSLVKYRLKQAKLRLKNVFEKEEIYGFKKGTSEL